MNNLQKFFGHLRTVNQHRLMVCRLCFKCGLYWQGLTHDLSKYSPVEFWNGVKYFTGTASPHVGERKDKGYSDAWIHHHNRNKHHGEYWQDIDKDGKSCSAPMPYKYLYEMVCDRVAASMIYLKDKYNDKAPLDYYLSHMDENQFHEETRTRLLVSLHFIADYGLDKFFKTFKEIN
jgi:hypothetical protein